MIAQLPAFITGWRKLPDELKLKVLEYALPAKIEAKHMQLINYGLERYGSNFRFQRRGWEPSKTIWSLLACPEMSGLAMEALYHGSIMAVWVFPKDGTFDLPPISVHRRVQHLQIILGLSAGSFDILARLANIFPALKQVDISIQQLSLMTPEMRKAIHEALDAAPSISFNTKALRVDYKPWSFINGPGLDGIQEPLFEKLAMSGNGVKERTEPGQNWETE
jgi:hypothetical protein